MLAATKKLAGLLALAVVPLTACGDDGGSVLSGGSGDGATEAALEATVRDAWDSLKRGDFDAMFGVMTQRCRDTYDTESDFAAEMAMGVGLIESFYDIEIAETEVGSVDITEFTPQRAKVAMSIVDGDGKPVFEEDEGGSEPVEYLYEDGWKSNDCEDENDAIVVGDDEDDADDDTDDADEGTSSTAVPKGPGSSRSEPVPVGQPLEFATDDAVFEITVTGAELDATAAVLAANEFNEPPPDGSVYAIVRYSATLVSADDEPVTPQFALEIEAVDSTNKELQSCTDAGVVWNGGDDGWDDLYVGGTMNLEACFVVEAANVGSLLLAIESFFSFDEVRAFFAVQ